jgi:hypothetical protein
MKFKLFAGRHLDFLAKPFDISSRLVDAVFGVFQRHWPGHWWMKG